ncbi:MAG TPA: prolyl oligopeptidase family serine peptidase [Cryptosporangiaceae bacterium]|nr:prolyl oligopeptidase family serine peptidase [Cryptosporangiaceae bacterium]
MTQTPRDARAGGEPAEPDAEISYPRLAARTRTFSLGQPRTVSVSSDGERVTFLRSSGSTDAVHALWVFDVPTGVERLVADPRTLLDGSEQLSSEERAMRERKRESSGGIVAYATGEAGRTAVFALSGQLYRADLVTGEVTQLPAAGPALDPRPSPAGDLVAYVTDGELHVLDDGTDRVLAAEEGITWGLAEFVAAEDMNRFRGYWWAPDGESILAARVDESSVPVWHIADPAVPEAPSVPVRYPHAGAGNAEVSLHVLSVNGGKPVEVGWDRASHPYLVTASWDESGCPLFTVMDRHQSQVRVLGADPATGEVSVHRETTGDPWVEVLPGTPELLGDGRLVWSADTVQTRRLVVGDTLVTPPGLYVRGYLGRLDGEPDPALLVEGTEDAPEQNHLYRVTADGTASRLTEAPGWYGAVVKGGTTVQIRRGLDVPGAVFTVVRDGRSVPLVSLAAAPPALARPALARVTHRQLPTGLVYPTGHESGRSLPVLVDIYGGPHHQEVVAASARWLERQWWADQGFAVVVVDGRGTPGVSPEFEHAVRFDLATPVLDDQVDGLRALAAEHPDLDLTRVGIRGWSFGGYLAALAVIRRPDVFHAAVAGAPVTDWALYDTFYTERYLGLPDEQPQAYARSSVLTGAGSLRRPLMVIHGLADDNVVAAHSLKLSSALVAAGRPHQVLPLTGVTHMAGNEVVAENLLLLQHDFLRRALTV